MLITFISDTHSLHHHLDLPGGDVLVHAGDLSSRGNEYEIIDFLNWFKVQNYTHKIFIAGNHDWFFELNSREYIQQIIPKSVIYLNDSGVTIDGVRFWGSPVQPAFCDWAFNKGRGEEINAHWKLIPNNVSVLITHGPPKGILDITLRGESVGCEQLTQRLEVLRPKIHVFGHIHEAYGIHETQETTFINASVLNFNYQCVNQPVHKILDLDQNAKY